MDAKPQLYLFHPETGEPLYLPETFLDDNGRLAYKKPNGDLVPAYRGRIFVLKTGQNVASGEQYLEVRFDRRGGQHTVTAPRRDLATPGGLINHFASAGAYVNTSNAGKLVEFLSDFEATNSAALPERLVSDRLGIMPGGVLVTPTTSIGGHVAYIGKGHEGFETGRDALAYDRTLREMTTWEGAHVLWWLLGLALASPFLQRLKPRRYPVVYLAGDSGVGKTTAWYFAMGAWASPGEEPFVAQGGRTTQAAFNRTLESLGGLPFLIDEAHTSEKPRDLENTVDNFANGQSYARGSAHGGVTGGTALGGVVILIGEARPEFEHAGSHNRLLLVNADLHPPLGARAGKATPLGMERAQLLESSWEQGAGRLGPHVAEAVLGDWAGLKTRVAKQRQRPDVLALRDWSHAVAVVQATLGVLFERVLGLPQPEDVTKLPCRLAEMLQTHRRESNPAEEAFEEIRTLMLQGERRPVAKGVELYLGSELVGWSAEGHWNLLTSSRALRQRLGSRGVRLHGRRWVELGWVIPDSRQGSSTQSVYCALRRSTGRVLVIPRAVLEEAPRQV